MRSGGRWAHSSIVWSGVLLYTGLVYLVVVSGGAVVTGSERLTRLALPMVATAILAVTFDRVRGWLRRLASRLLYGHRKAPVESLTEFARRIGQGLSSEEMFMHIARILGEGSGAERTQVWVRVGGELVLGSQWPRVPDEVSAIKLDDERLPKIEGADLVTPVIEGGDLLGALTVTKRVGPVTGIDRKLTEDLASQAGVVLRNARISAEINASLERLSALADELRGSRRRLVAVQDTERRRIEHRLHDEAQQYLVALVIQLDRARKVLDKEPGRARELLPQTRKLHEEVTRLLQSFAEEMSLARLQEAGPVASIQRHIERLDLPVELRADQVDRYPTDVEEAIYYTALEAIQNALKHAGATKITVSLSGREDELKIVVSDDGRGGPHGELREGTGIAGMRRRLEEHDGILRVKATSTGTTVVGSIPLRMPAGAVK